MSATNIQCMAMKCMTLYSLIHKEICDQTAILQVCYDTLVHRGQDLNAYTALKSCFDIFLAFPYLRDEFENAWLFESDEEKEEPDINYSEILNIMSYYIDCNDEYASQSIHFLAIDGFSKLLMLSMIPNAEGILSKVMLQYFNANSTCETKQLLQGFFQYYTKMGDSNSLNFLGAYKRIIALYISWLVQGERERIDDISISQMNFKKIFVFSSFLISPTYLQNCPGQWMPSVHYHVELFYYVALTLLKVWES